VWRTKITTNHLEALSSITTEWQVLGRLIIIRQYETKKWQLKNTTVLTLPVHLPGFLCVLLPSSQAERYNGDSY